MTALFDKVCSIFCQSKAVDASAIRELVDRKTKVDLKGEPGSWESLTFVHPGGQLVLHRRVFTGPGFSGPNGKFNSAVLGAGNYFKNVKTADAAVRKKLVADISKTETLIGCVATPRMTDAGYALIFEVARRFGGMIFDSDAMLDPDGIVLLDVEGNRGYRREREP